MVQRGRATKLPTTPPLCPKPLSLQFPYVLTNPPTSNITKFVISQNMSDSSVVEGTPECEHPSGPRHTNERGGTYRMQPCQYDTYRVVTTHSTYTGQRARPR